MSQCINPLYPLDPAYWTMADDENDDDGATTDGDEQAASTSYICYPKQYASVYCRERALVAHYVGFDDNSYVKWGTS